MTIPQQAREIWDSLRGPPSASMFHSKEDFEKNRIGKIADGLNKAVERETKALKEENDRLRRLHITAEGSFEKLANLFENGSIIVPDTADKETVLLVANELDAIADLRDFCMGEST